MQISIVTPDLSENCLGRAYVLAELAKKNYEVEIIGPELGQDIWGPLKDKYDYKSVRTSPRIDQFIASIPELLENITGDVVYTSKPKVNSYGISLLNSINNKYPLILDIDDWESGLAYNNSRLLAYLKGIPALIHVNSLYYTRLFELLTSLADAQTVSNRFLQGKFKGEIIPHARDTDHFDPTKFHKKNIRKEMGLPLDKFLVVFSGTPRPYKGVEDLAKALAHIDHPEIKGVIVGASESDYVKKIKCIGGNSLTVKGKQPFNEIPKWVAAADVIAIPQRDTLATRGQLPAKVFDAMAMAKPIIATSVSDLPAVLNRCGRIINPEAPAQLREAILELFSNDSLREEMGQAARRRCIEQYSYDALAPVLNDVVSSVIDE